MHLVRPGLDSVLPEDVVEAIIVARVGSELSPECQASPDDIPEALAPIWDFLTKMVL